MLMRSPGANWAEAAPPFTAIAWGAASSFIQVTVWPAEIVVVAGVNAKPRIFTSAGAFGAPIEAIPGRLLHGDLARRVAGPERC